MPADEGPLAPQPGGIPWDETLHMTAADGVFLRGALWRGGARGLVLILAGRTEFLEGFALLAAEFVGRGFSVACLDWRGQGLSERLIQPHLKGHVGRFADYQMDLRALTAHPSVAEIPGPRVVVANSMGAVIALRALTSGTLDARAAVLLAPMMGILMTPVQAQMRRFLLPMARAAGALDLWPPLPGRAQPYVFQGFEGNVLTSNREMFEWYIEILRDHPRLQVALPTMRWVDEALREIAWLRRQGPLDCPSLVLVGTCEAVVDPQAARTCAVETDSRLVMIEGGRHDLLVEPEPISAQCWREIDALLDESGV